MRLPPPEVVATWPEPNYTNPEARGPGLIIVEFFTLAIALVSVCLRLYVKFQRSKMGWDDLFMVAAAVLGAGVCVSVTLAFELYGWDMHIWDLTQAKIVAGRQISFAAQALFLGATSFAKISILLTYAFLFSFATPGSWFRHLTVGIMWFIVVTNLGYFIVLLTQCTPTSSYWHLEHQRTDCINESPSLISHAVVNALTDFVVWVLPLRKLFKLQRSLLDRIGLVVLFSFSSVVVIAGCVRTYWIYVIVVETYDVTWEGFQLWMWTAVEVHLGVICGCVPWLKSLFNLWQEGRDDSRAVSGATRTGTRSRSITVCEEGAVIKMDSLGKASSPREAYMDLESCRTSTRSPGVESG
ncbi:hypothetical protein VTK26DRAFT_486 [Humicola hyalothermophila]